MSMLYYPSDSNGRYLRFINTWYGPLGSSGIVGVDQVPFQGKLIAMEEKRGIYGENEVRHAKLDGDFFYHPVLQGSRPSPSAQYPRSLQLKEKSTGMYWTADYGMAAHKGTSFGRLGTGLSPLHKAYEYDSDRKTWITYILDTVGNAPPYRILQVQKIVITSIEPIYGTMHLVRYSSQDASNGELTRIQGDFGTQLAYQDFMEIVNKAIWSVPFYTSQFSDIYTLDTGNVKSPKSCMEELDSLMYSLIPGTFPIPEVHYGDLAMKAAEKRLDCSVNMLEFFRDLKDVKSLIPRLSALRSLKGMSGQYLAVKYGVLPTISDLTSIWQAATSRRKYGSDANGFTVYRASHSETKIDQGLAFSLDQRIKLAIEDEDSTFQEILDRLDHIGILPTFERVWDMTKYSFILDWFIDVGGFLERADTRLRLARYNVKYATMSRTLSMSGYSAGTTEYPFVGTVLWGEYHRWVTDRCPLPPFTLQVNPLPISHWLEGSALLLQRRRH